MPIAGAEMALGATGPPFRYVGIVFQNTPLNARKWP